jgi:hypothetical protein
MHDDLYDRSREYFNDQMITGATFLDPRYRNFRFIKDDHERKKALKAVKTYIISTCVEKFKIVTLNAIDEYEPPAKRNCNEPKTKSNFSLLYENQIPKITNCSHQKEIEQEINNYESVALHVDDESNPLEFYRDNEILFKNLSQMAKMLFSITASSVAS